MAAFIKSIETISTTFTTGTTLETKTVNLTKGQDETQCAPFGISCRTTGNVSFSYVGNFMVSVEMIDNGGTPAARIKRNRRAGVTAIAVELTIVEFGSNVTVQQGGAAALTSSSVTATITSVVQANSYLVFTSHATTWNNPFDDLFVQAKFNSNTQIAFERRGTSNDHDIYWYVIESDGTDFLTEYIEDSWTSGETGPTNLTLSNTVTLANAFIVPTYESGEAGDDLRDAICQQALTGTTTLTWYRDNSGSPSATGTLGTWVVRASATEFDVQRLAPDVDDGTNTTFNQTITAVDLDQAVVIIGQSIHTGVWAMDRSTAGSNVDDRIHAVWLTSTTNVRMQRRTDADIAPSGASTNPLRFEVVEFVLESGGVTTLIADPGSYIWTGQTANLEHHEVIVADAGSYSWTGQNVTLTKSTIINAESGVFNWTGQAATLLFNELINANAGSYAWTGQDATLTRQKVLTAEGTSYTWAGQAANLLHNKAITAEAGTYAWTGQIATLLHDEKLVAEGTTYTWTGQDADLLVSTVLAADGTSYSWTGQTATLLVNELLTAESVSYSWTGQVANLERALLLAANAGSYAWTGQDATLTITTVEDIILTADPGSYTWTGQVAELRRPIKLSALGDSYSWQGKEATLTRQKKIVATGTAYNWTGQAADLGVFLDIQAESGVYIWTGQDASLLEKRLLAAGTASYTWAGKIARLVHILTAASSEQARNVNLSGDHLPNATQVPTQQDWASKSIEKLPLPKRFNRLA